MESNRAILLMHVLMELLFFLHAGYSFKPLIGIQKASGSNRSVYCDPKHHWYYRSDLDKCRPCDKCVIGEGKNTPLEVEMDSKHGALTCPPCVKCSKGMYSHKRAHFCKNCTLCSGLVLKKCNQSADTLCEENFIFSPNRQISPTTISESPDKDTAHSQNMEKILNPLVSSFLGFICVVLLFGGVFWYWRDKRKKRLNSVSTVKNLTKTTDSMELQEIKVVEDNAKLTTVEQTALTKDISEDGGSANMCSPSVLLAKTTENFPLLSNHDEVVKTSMSEDQQNSNNCFISQDFHRNFSKKVAANLDLEQFGEHFGLNKNTVRIIIRENMKERGRHECSYKMVKKITEVHPNTTENDFEKGYRELNHHEYSLFRRLIKFLFK